MSKPQEAFMIMTDEDRRVLAEAFAGMHELNRDLWRTTQNNKTIEKHLGQALGAMWLLVDHFELDAHSIQEDAERIKEVLRAELAKKVC